MATVRVNDAGTKNAERLIRDGRIAGSKSWDFTTEDGASLLGANGDDWTTFGSYHLGIRTGVSRKTKKSYAYPFGKNGEVYRSALIAARSRAAQQGHTAIFEAAGRLLAKIDGEKMRDQGRSMIAENMESINAHPVQSFSFEAVDPADLPNAFVQLLPYTGDEYAKTLDGRQIKVTDDSLFRVVERFNERSNPLLLDFDHNTYNPFLPMSSLAAGWIYELAALGPDAHLDEIEDQDVAERVREYGPGVYARVDLTTAAAAKIRDREYMFLSPVVVMNDDDEVIEIIGAGLTNDPALDGLMPVAARRTWKNVELDTDDDPTDTLPGGDTIATDDDEESPDAASAGSTGSETESMEVQTMSDVDLKEIATALGRDVSDPKDVAKAILELREAATRSEENAARLAAEALRREAEDAVENAVATHRVVESQREFMVEMFVRDRDAFDRYLAATPENTFATTRDVPPQGRQTANVEDVTTAGLDVLEDVKFFDRTIPVNQEQAAKLQRAIALSREKFGGDLARAIRAVRR